MKTLNSVQLIGYVGADPQMRTAVNGSLFARFRIATDYFRRRKDGTMIKKTTWHHILVWDRLAENVPTHFIKGSHILVQGQIRHRNFKNKLGEIRSISEVHATTLLNLDR